MESVPLLCDVAKNGTQMADVRLLSKRCVAKNHLAVGPDEAPWDKPCQLQDFGYGE